MSLMLLFPFSAHAGSGTEVARPNIDETPRPRSVTLRGQTYVDHGLVGAGSLPADTVDFLGDTLGSFSSLKMERASWRRVDDHYEGVLWTLPDRGRNDPAAKLFFDYPARLERFRVTLTPSADPATAGRFALVPDGGIVLKDFGGRPFTGADPGGGTRKERGVTLPAPARGVGKGKISLDAESLQFTADGSFYIGDEYTANVYYFDKAGHLQGVIRPPGSVMPKRRGKIFFGSLETPETGRRNNQGPEGMSLSPDGTTLFVVLQSALVQDSASGNAVGRINTRVLVYDVSKAVTPEAPRAIHVVQLPIYREDGDGGPADRTAAQSEILALDDHRFLMLARDGAGIGAGEAPIMYKSVLLVDTAEATNLAGTPYETGTASILDSAASTALKPGIVPASEIEFINLLSPDQLGQAGLSVDTLSEKWEAMDLVPVLEPSHPADYFLLVGNDNDFIARACRMSGERCDSQIDNDSRILVYRVSLPPGVK